MKRYPSQIWSALAAGLVLLCLNAAAARSHAAPAPSLDAYNVVWTTPSTDSRGSMPLGNGDIGVNAWVEASGDLVFYISKTDAWGDDVFSSYGLPKVGRVRIKLDPNPFAAGQPFVQTLRLQDGVMRIQAGSAPAAVNLALWVDANNPVIHVDGQFAAPEHVQVIIDTYRQQKANHLNADVVFPAQKTSVAWCYRNGNTKQPELTNLTFGALINGDGLASASDSTLQTGSARQLHVRIYPLTTHSATPEAWYSQAQTAAADGARRDRNLDAVRARHDAWWKAFWNRSWVVATGDADADSVTQSYFRQRYVSACAGRGAYPIKFNGSIFTTDYTVTHNNKGVKTTEDVDGDYRTWGGQYWFQNTRPMYWPMLQSGDFDMMQPLFRMYLNKLPASEALIKQYYGHDGCYFPETAPFWGTVPDITPTDTPLFTKHYFTPILELSAMMLDYYDYTADSQFLHSKLLPIADQGATFFDEHFPKGADGKLDLKPDNAIETYWGVENPAPDIAGLHYVMQRLLDLPAASTTQTERALWQKVLAETPDLPMGTSSSGEKVLVPYGGQAPDPNRHNGENPELYAVYPFRIYGLGRPDLQVARDTFNVRKARGTTCWLQDPIHAAYLGLADLAKRDVTINFSDKSRDQQERFPVFWGPFHDYTPDEDNGGNGQLCLHLMLLQPVGQKLLLLPAWPDGWDASFKLHAPQNTVVEGEVHGGKLISLTVTPATRRKDVFLVQTDGTLVPY